MFQSLTSHGRSDHKRFDNACQCERKTFDTFSMTINKCFQGYYLNIDYLLLDHPVPKHKETLSVIRMNISVVILQPSSASNAVN